MSYIKTSDILIRDRNKLFLQVNYNLDDAIKVIGVKISIDGIDYESSYFNLDYAVFKI